MGGNTRGPKPGKNWLNTANSKVSAAVYRLREATKQVEDLRQKYPELVAAAERSLEEESRVQPAPEHLKEEEARVEAVPVTSGRTSSDRCSNCGESLTEGHKCFS